MLRDDAKIPRAPISQPAKSQAEFSGSFVVQSN